MSKLLWRYGDVLLCLALLLLFWVVPNIDLVVARDFYRPGSGFWLSEQGWVQLPYKLFAKGWIVAVIWLLLLGVSYIPVAAGHLASRRKVLVYLLLTVLIGPGLIVHNVLKDHWGRARPVHLVEFGGTKQFSPPAIITDQCDKNCSFVSGHVAIAAYLMAAYWVSRKRRWLVAGAALGLYVGVVRMVMGAHFLSDVIFAIFVVHFTLRAFSSWLLEPPVDKRL